MNQKDSWLRLDNAGKVFPATSGKHDTGVFRFACTLTEPISESGLQQALDRTLEKFPHFLYVLCGGLFWYYLEPGELKPICHAENTGICSQLFYRNKRSLLFDISYHGCRINMDIYHALADGTGAMHFFRYLICRYLSIIHPDTFEDELAEEISFAPASVRTEDSFSKYYKHVKKEKNSLPKRVYHLKGHPGHGYTVVEGLMSCKKIHALAKEKGVTITEFLCSLVIMAIRHEMPVRERTKPIVINLPVNLRNYFESDTARNFFGNVHISYTFGKDEDKPENIAEALHLSLQKELNRDNLMKNISGYVSMERNPFIKIVPLTVKNFFIRIARHIASSKETIVISNVGIVKMPPETQKFIRHMSVLSSTSKTQICICTCGDTLSVGFSSRFEDTDIQRNFFRFLTDMGVDVQIESNLTE